MPDERLEWSGRWDDLSGGEWARAMALSLPQRELAFGLVRISRLAETGAILDRVVASRDEVEAWDPAAQSLPAASRPATLLPPPDADSIEREALTGCNRALSPAVDAKLLLLDQTRAILLIVQEAFAGVGPAGRQEIAEAGPL